MTLTTKNISLAATELSKADALFIGAGAGIGVDSGLPDFRGNKGFWKAYPPFAKRGLSFMNMANPRWFDNEPKLAWGFYGHRLNLYRQTVPHEGFHILKSWSDNMKQVGFVFTSNVDGQFQKAGFSSDRVAECHGSIHHMQCSAPCHNHIWSASGIEISVDESTFNAGLPLPRCPKCSSVARPNILMFGDCGWLSERTADQENLMEDWLSELNGKSVAVVEMGAGTAVPSVRYTCENVARRFKSRLIRINPREEMGPAGTISIPMGALEALTLVDKALL